jgi:hypothetical protein
MHTARPGRILWRQLGHETARSLTRVMAGADVPGAHSRGIDACSDPQLMPG